MALYHPKSSGAAERGVGLVNAIMKNTENNGSNSEQLFFLRNWRDPKLPDLKGEPKPRRWWRPGTRCRLTG